MYTRFYVLWNSVTDCSVIYFIQRIAATAQAATGDGSGTQKKGTASNFVVVGKEQAFVNTEFISCSCVLREHIL